MKIEECRPSDAGAIFKLPTQEKENTPDKILKVTPRYNAF